MVFIFRRFVSNIKMNQKIFNLQSRFQHDGSYNYEAAIDALNTLQSNAVYLKNTQTQNNQQGIEKFQDTYKFLKRAKIDLSELKSVIHVTGTKGKGSTCSLCKHILQAHGYKTGFYSSPHLISVTERIRINGNPIKNSDFAKCFWEICDNLHETSRTRNGEHENWPIYFQMLTLIAFKTFIESKVDVAIIEVGIGGEFDTTNVIKDTEIVGITSLGLDHTSLLGNTIESISWHKGGIMKPFCQAFTVKQCDSALKVLKERSLEKKCSLEVVKDQKLPFDSFQADNEVFRLNYSLAYHLAQSWLEKRGQSINERLLKTAVETHKWPGRYEIIKDVGSLNFYLDGAHTYDSLEYCAQWFLHNTLDSKIERALIFNCTGGRDASKLMESLQMCDFKWAFFVPNIPFADKNTKDNLNNNYPLSEQMLNCGSNKEKWLEISKNRDDKVLVKSSVYEAVAFLEERGKFNVLITGSLHLVGSAFNVLTFLVTNGAVS